MIIHQKNLIPHTIYRTHSQIILLFRFFSTPKHFSQQFQNQLPNPNPTHSNTSSSKTFHRKMAPHSQLHATTSSPPAPTIKNAPKRPTSNQNNHYDPLQKQTQHFQTHFKSPTHTNAPVQTISQDGRQTSNCKAIYAAGA